MQHTFEGENNNNRRRRQRSSKNNRQMKKEVLFKNCRPFSVCISIINNTQVDNAKDLDFVMLMYSLVEYNRMM